MARRTSLGHVQTKAFSQNDVIFREGDESSEAYRLLSGHVEISIATRDGARSLARLAAGEFFGEMSLIDDKPRSATATALTDCEVEVIHEENFAARVLGDPGNLHVYLRTLFDRLRATDALLQWHLNRASAPGQPRSSIDAALHATGASAQGPGSAPAAAGPPRLRVISTSVGELQSDVLVTKIPFRIGRATQGGHGLAPLAPNDLSLPDHLPYQVSRNHCVIEDSGHGLLVRDLGSRLGTIVNGVKLGIDFDSFVAPLKPGDNILTLGDASGPHHFRVIVL
jgi:CRP-like cAMP-binding protein